LSATPPATNEHLDRARPPAARLVLVVPCFNEAKRLKVEAFCEFAQRNPFTGLLFVDDGSTDTTPDVLESLRLRAPDSIEAIRLPINKGKAEAVRSGMLWAIDSGADFAGYWDADLATPLDEVSRFMDILLSDEDVFAVIGARVQLLGTSITRSPARHYLGRVFATAASIVLRMAVYDTQCGAKIFRLTPSVRQAFEEPFSGRWIFDVELLGRIINRTASAGDSPRGKGMVEIPVRQWVDVKGSRLKPSDCVRSAWDLAALAMRGIRR
jgi:dolichyl-phosphate beta-glucosyltransferase